MDLIFEYVTSVIKMDETDYADKKKRKTTQSVGR